MANGRYSEVVGMAMLIINAMMKQARLEQLKLDLVGGVPVFDPFRVNEQMIEPGHTPPG